MSGKPQTTLADLDGMEKVEQPKWVQKLIHDARAFHALHGNMERVRAFIERVANGPTGSCHTECFEGDVGFVVHVRAEARELLGLTDSAKGT